MNTHSRISLIIPAHNEEKYIRACLESIAGNSAGLLHEIIVVDNASADNTADVARKASKEFKQNIPSVKIVREEKRGTSAARQKGFEESNGDLVAFIDADCRLPPGWCEKVLNEFNKNPLLVALSGPYTYYDARLWQRTLIKIFWHTLAYPFYFLIRYMALGGNLVMRRTALEKMGGLDTSITFYGDDTDMVRRASKFGKVKFKFSFTIASSARRLHGQGLFRTGLVYGINFFSQVFLKRSATKEARHDAR